MASMICDGCGESLLGQKIRQIQFLTSARNSFLKNVDPLANEGKLLQDLVSRNILKPYDVERLKQVYLGREKRAEKFWLLLVRVPHHSFFAAVEPLLTKHYATIFKAASSAVAGQRQKMCFCDVAEVVLPLKEMAENLKEFLKDSDYDFLLGKAQKNKRWERFWRCLKNTLHVHAVATVFQKFLNDAEIPEPTDLCAVLSKGLGCVCNITNKKPAENREGRLLCPQCKEESGCLQLGNIACSLVAEIGTNTSEERQLGANARAYYEKAIPLWKPMFWYPKVTPPTGTKEEIFCIEDFTDVDARATSAPSSLNKSFEELVAYLTEPWTTDLQKVRSFFTWMGGQKIGARTFEQAEPDTPEYFMKKVSENETFFLPKLFVVLCRTAGIPCMTVRGKAKAVGYQLGDKSSCAGGLWTIVCIDNNWRFVHPHWALTCSINFNDGRWTLVEEAGRAVRQRISASSGVIVSQVDEFWFLTDPDKMNIYCHAEDPQRQLMVCPLTLDEFVNMPSLTKECFESPWKLLRPHTAKIETVSGVCTIDYMRPLSGHAELRYKLFFDEDESEEKLPEAPQVEMYIIRLKGSSDTLSLVTRLPVRGIYKIDVIGYHQSVTHDLGSFLLICKSASPESRPFPSVPDIGFGYDQVAEDAGLTEPSRSEGVVPVKEGQAIDFQFRVQRGVDVRPKLRHGSCRPEDLAVRLEIRRDASDLSVGVVLPTDDPHPEYSLEFYVPRDDRCQRGTFQSDQEEDEDEENLDGFFNVLSYLLTSDKDIHDASKNEAKEIHKELEKAVNAEDEATLKEALGRFEQNALYDPVALNRAKARQAAYDKIRDDLLAAVRSRSMERIASALSEFEAHRLIDDGIIAQTLDRILSLAESGIRRSIESQSLLELEAAMARATSSRMAEAARQSSWFKEAQDIHYQLMTLARTSDVVKSFTLVGLLFMCEQPRPNMHLLALLKATYLLLGEKEKDVSNWQSIQSRLRAEGDNSLKKRLQNFRITRLDKQTVDKAGQLLSTCDKHVVANESNIGAKLLTWCESTISDFRSKTA